MMQDGNESRSNCGVMLALGGCCAIACVLRWGRVVGRSVGRSIRFSGGRESSDFFPPLGLSPYAAGAAQDPKGGNQVCLCQLAARW